VKVAVIAHSGKTLGGGLPELRRVLQAEGVDEPFWCEVPKSSKAPAQVRRALDEGAELIFAWGGDGMVQRCVDVLAGSTVSLAIIPAGTANLFATNLGIPKDIQEAVAVGLRGERRSLGVGSHRPFDQWGTFVPDHTTAVSMIDRLLHHAVVVVTEGESFRMKEAKSRGGDRPTKTAQPDPIRQEPQVTVTRD
jgi:hypothetical protein